MIYNLQDIPQVDGNIAVQRLALVHRVVRPLIEVVVLSHLEHF